MLRSHHQRTDSSDSHDPLAMSNGPRTKAAQLAGRGNSRPGSPLTHIAQDQQTLVSHNAGHSSSGDVGISLEAWSRDLLEEEQLASISKLSDWVQAPHASSASKAAASKTDPTLGDLAANEEAKASPSASETSAHPFSLPLAPVTSSAALLSWLELVKDSPPSASSADRPSTTKSSHVDSLAHITEALEWTNSLLDQLEKARINVAELKAGSRAIEETSEELRDESEQRGGKMDSLARLVSDLEGYLSYYSLLPTATAFLSEPNLSRVVLSDRFAFTLAQCDVGLTFIKAHPHFRDAAIYRLRFEHCITRAGDLARLWTCGKIKELTSDAHSRLKERERNLKGRPANNASEDPAGEQSRLLTFASPDLFGILYPRFCAAAPELRSVLSNVIRRCPPSEPSSRDTRPSIGAARRRAVDQKEPLDEESMLADFTADDIDIAQPDQESMSQDGTPEVEDGEINTFSEFLTLLKDCRNAYFDARRSLLTPLISSVLSRTERIASEQTTMKQQETDTSAAGDQSKGRPRAASHSANSPLMAFLSQGLDIVKSVLISEYMLYSEIFGDHLSTSASTALVDFLKSLAKELLDRVHPRIYAENKISSLANVATCILASVPLDPSRDPDAGPHDGYLLFSKRDPYDFTSIPQLFHFASGTERTTAVLRPLIQPLYADVSSRISFRTKAVLHGREIAGYAPTKNEVAALIAKMTQGPRAEILGLAVPSDASDGRKRRGRSSVGVGVLEAAASKALAEHNEEQNANNRGSTGHSATHDTSIELFRLPAPSVLNTWFASLVRAFSILSALHKALERGEFATLAIETIDCARTSVLKCGEVLKATLQNEHVRDDETSGHHDRLDAILFSLRHSLLLREMAASVDLSLLQLSDADFLHDTLRTSSSSTMRPATLDANVLMKVMGGILEAMGDASRVFSSSASAERNPKAGEPERSGTTSQLTEDVTKATSHTVRIICETCLHPVFEDDTLAVLSSPSARLEESLLPSLRRCRRRVALYIEDDALVARIMQGVFAAIEDDLVDKENRRDKKVSVHLHSQDARQLSDRLASRMGIEFVS
ncbi:unnamed protein product [Parajaminaea phylloscopi]